MATHEELYEFLKSHYLHSRFEGRNQHWPKGITPEGVPYSELVCSSVMKVLNERGFSWISHFDSNSGRAIKFDCELKILNPDEPKVEIQYLQNSWYRTQ